MTILYSFLSRDEDIYITHSANEILNHYGEAHQRSKLAEECAEFAAARVKNALDPSAEHEARETEELADVIVLIEQRISALKPPEARKLAMQVMSKIDRTLRQISREREAQAARDIEHGC